MDTSKSLGLNFVLNGLDPGFDLVCGALNLYDRQQCARRTSEQLTAVLTGRAFSLPPQYQ